MEMLIGGLLFGVVILVIFVFTSGNEETNKVVQAIEPLASPVIGNSKDKKISDLEADCASKESEIKTIMELRRKLEEEYFKVKDEADILKKDNTEISQKLKQLEKSKEDLSSLKDEIKGKDAMLSQETLARQKLQGEVSLKDVAYDGLKAQLSEIEGELVKLREEGLSAKGGSASGGKKPEPSKILDVPGLTSSDSVKIEIKKEMPSDTDFLKDSPEQKKPIPPA